MISRLSASRAASGRSLHLHLKWIFEADWISLMSDLPNDALYQQWHLFHVSANRRKSGFKSRREAVGAESLASAMPASTQP